MLRHVNCPQSSRNHHLVRLHFVSVTIQDDYSVYWTILLPTISNAKTKKLHLLQRNPPQQRTPPTKTSKPQTPNMEDSHKNKKSPSPTQKLIAGRPRRNPGTKSRRQKIQASRKSPSIQKVKFILRSPSRGKSTRTRQHGAKPSQNPQRSLSRNNSVHPVYSRFATA